MLSKEKRDKAKVVSALTVGTTIAEFIMTMIATGESIIKVTGCTPDEANDILNEVYNDISEQVNKKYSKDGDGVMVLRIHK